MKVAPTAELAAGADYGSSVTKLRRPIIVRAEVYPLVSSEAEEMYGREVDTKATC